MYPHTLEVLEFVRIVDLVGGRCVSEPGRRLASRLAPLASLDQVREAHAKLDEMIGLLEREGHVPIEETGVVEPLLQRSAVEGSALEPKELLLLLRAARVADDVERFFRKRSGACPKLAALTGGLDPLTDVQMRIARAVDEEGVVTDHASPELAAIREETEQIRREVLRILERRLKAKSADHILQEDLITLRNGRYVLPVKEGAKRKIEGIVHDHSGTGQTVFIEPMETVERNNLLARLRREEEREIRRIRKDLTDRVRENASLFSSNATILAQVDLLQGKGLLARATESRIPDIGKGGRIRIIQGRHPLLELSLDADGRREELVPLDLEYPEECRTLVLTGPNTGGKTVALKTLGLFTVMAQAGLALPSGEGTRIRYFDRVFGDIGDEQSIENSLSSFAAHLRQMVLIVNGAGENTLVLLDELGSGTDPTEGAALAQALLEELHERGATSLVTTHLGALKVFVHDREGMENASMAFDREKLRPTYRLEVGLPGTSHAIEIAARLGLPERVVARAREGMACGESEMESLITDLRARGRDLDARERRAAEDRERLDRTLREVEEREKKLGEEERSVRRRVLEEADRLLDETRARVERIVRDLRSGGADREAVRGAHDALEETKRLVDDARGEPGVAEAAPKPIAVGQNVHVRTMDRVGRVVGMGNREGKVFVETGGIRLEVALADLEPTEATGKKQAIRPSLETPRPEPRLELDLRGMTADEARDATDKFLDDAFLSGVPRVRIVHGIGTGTLRREITRMLTEDPRVLSHELGGNGGFSTAEIHT
ncbi:MAG: endonuclease MutS2 [Candidatus Eisenbacteria bacterium]|nr:endonuclease MutS2 [Candidatus Eisenbacteria bacterium]